MKSNLPNLIEVDASRCRRDLRCAAVCPVGLIVAGPDGPVIAGDAAQRCAECGHCVAVCPTGALSHRVMKPSECAPLPGEWRLRPELVEVLLKARRSCRAYRNEPVAREILERVIDAARYAPSGLNRQPVKWLVVHDRAAVRGVLEAAVAWMRGAVRDRLPVADRLGLARLVAGWDAGTDPIGRGAPHLIVAHANQQEMTAPAACLIALSHLEIAALPFGLGTCWAGYLMAGAAASPAVGAAFGLPAGHAVFGVMMIGYPKFSYQRIPLRRPADIGWR